MGCFGQSGTVHPQEPLALEILSGSIPLLMNSKEYLFSESTLTFPKSFTSVSKKIVVVGPFEASFNKGFVVGLAVGFWVKGCVIFAVGATSTFSQL